MEKKRYIPVKGRKIYVEKELFDEYNRIRSRQCYHNNKYAAATCELKETDQNRHCESVEETVMRDFDKNQLMQAIRTLPLTEQEILQDASFTETADFEKIEADAYIGNLRKMGSDS